MIENILEQRGKRYGDFADNAELSQALKETMRCAEHWDLKPAYVREALDNIQQKIARIINGDHLWTDSVIDIVGYATLMQSQMEGQNAYSADEGIST